MRIPLALGTAILVVAAGLPTPAVAAQPPARARAASASTPAPAGFTAAGSTARTTTVPARRGKKEQVPVRPSKVADTLADIGTTRVVTGKIKTNAGKRAKVRVRVSDAYLKRNKHVRTKSHSKVTYRKSGAVDVWVSGTHALQVDVTMTAPATEDHSSMDVTTTYVTAPVPALSVGGIGSDFFFSIIKGVGTEIGEQAGGWALGSLFGTGGDAAALAQISAQLQAIQNQLNQISDKIDELTKELHAQTCDITTEQLADAVADIREANREYQVKIGTGVYDQADLLQWVSANQRPVEKALSTIDLNLEGMASTHGSIANCAASFKDVWKQPLGESSYYSMLYNYLQYFYQWQILGTNLASEADHFLAAVNAKTAGAPLDPTAMQTICLNPLNSTIASNCRDAYSIVSMVYDDITGQTVLGGAGYSWNVANGPEIAVQAGTSRLWATELNKYGDLTGCTTPLSSTKAACGPTIGTNNPLGLTAGLGYNGWTTANSADWFSVLRNNAPSPTSRYSEIMDAVGFKSKANQDMIIYTAEADDGTRSAKTQWLDQAVIKWWRNPSYSGGWWAFCFMDTAMVHTAYDMPICDGSANRFSDMMNVYHSKVKWGETSYWFTLPDPIVGHDWVSNAAFYNGSVTGSVDTYGNDDMDLSALTGFMYAAGHPGTPQYRWPVLDVSGPTITCGTYTINNKTYTPGKTNSGGAYSMCGDDFKAWFDSWMPPAPTPYNS